MKSKKEIFTSSEDKWDFIIALIVIILFSVFIFKISFKKDEKIIADKSIELDESQIKQTAIVNEKSEKGKKGQHTYKNSSIYETKTIKVEEIHQNKIKRAVVISDVTESEPLVIEVNDNNSITTTFSKDKIEVKDTVITNQEPEIKLEKEQPETTVVKLEQEIETEQNTTNTTLNCVIVIGVFKELNNKVAITKKLTELGYDHSEGPLRKDLNFVGVPIACDDKQRKTELLNELNQAFGIQSWVKKI